MVKKPSKTKTSTSTTLATTTTVTNSHEVGLVALAVLGFWLFGCLVVWSFGRLLCSVCCFRLFGTSFDFRSKLFLQYCFLLTAALLTTIPVGFVVVVVVVLTQASFYNKETGIPTTWYSALGTYTVPPPSAASKLDSRQCGQFDVHLVWLSTAVTPAASHLPHPRRGFLGGDGSRAVYQSLTGTTHTHP